MVHIGPFTPGRLSLELLVCVPVGAVVAQPVTEEQVPPFPGTATVPQMCT